MKNFTSIREIKHPKTGKWENPLWLANHYDKGEWGVKFSDGEVFNPLKYEFN